MLGHIAEIKTVIFSSRTKIRNEIRNEVKKYLIIDPSLPGTNSFEKSYSKIDLVQNIKKQYGEVWAKEYSSWIASQNNCWASLRWWAYSLTAKNLLSSPLAEDYFTVRAIVNLIENTSATRIYVTGISQSQTSALDAHFSRHGYKTIRKSCIIRSVEYAFKIILILLRNLYQLMSAYIGFFAVNQKNIKPNISTCYFTYMDKPITNKEDNYFGRLFQDWINEEIKCLAYICKPYRNKRLILNSSDFKDYLILFEYLTMFDYLSVSFVFLKELFGIAFFNKYYKNENKTFQAAVLHFALLHDLSYGGYVYHLLTYRAVFRIMQKMKPDKFIYPYENKSIEKMILLAIKNVDETIEVFGYQHTSITPRHLTLLFEENEIKHTPLPDKIITCGSLPANYLEKNGNYPKRIFINGCALRQRWGKKFRRNNYDRFRVLVSLSSSKQELHDVLHFFMKIINEDVRYIVAFRPHPHINLPMSLLADEYHSWIKDNILDFSHTDLEENLKWCDAVVYVSSTVALDALLRGKPVLHISTNEIISSDPLLDIEGLRLYQSINNSSEFRFAVDEILNLSEDEYQKAQIEALDYANIYFTRPSKETIRHFL